MYSGQTWWFHDRQELRWLKGLPGRLMLDLRKKMDWQHQRIERRTEASQDTKQILSPARAVCMLEGVVKLHRPGCLGSMPSWQANPKMREWRCWPALQAEDRVEMLQLELSKQSPQGRRTDEQRCTGRCGLRPADTLARGPNDGGLGSHGLLLAMLRRQFGAAKRHGFARKMRAKKRCRSQSKLPGDKVAFRLLWFWGARILQPGNHARLKRT